MVHPREQPGVQLVGRGHCGNYTTFYVVSVTHIRTPQVKDSHKAPGVITDECPLWALLSTQGVRQAGKEKYLCLTPLIFVDRGARVELGLDGVFAGVDIRMSRWFRSFRSGRMRSLGLPCGARHGREG